MKHAPLGLASVVNSLLFELRLILAHGRGQAPRRAEWSLGRRFACLTQCGVFDRQVCPPFENFRALQKGNTDSITSFHYQYHKA